MSDMGRDRGNDRFPRADDDGVLSGQCFGIPDKVFDLIQCVDALRSIGKDGPGLHPFGPKIDKWGEPHPETGVATEGRPEKRWPTAIADPAKLRNGRSWETPSRPTTRATSTPRHELHEANAQRPTQNSEVRPQDESVPLAGSPLVPHLLFPVGRHEKWFKKAHGLFRLRCSRLPLPFSSLV